MLTSADIARVDLLNAEIQNRPSTKTRADELTAGFELLVPENPPSASAKHATARMKVVITTKIKKSPASDVETSDNHDVPEEDTDELELRWKGEFTYGFLVDREKRELLESGDGGATARAVWPFIRSELMAFMKQSVDAPPLPFQINVELEPED